MSAAELWQAYESCELPGLRGAAWDAWFAQAIREGRDPSGLRRNSFDLDERIDAYIIEGLDGCLLWDGRLNVHGNPIVSKPITGHTITVRPYLVRRAGRDVPEHRRVVPGCGTKLCVRTDHLHVEEHNWLRKHSVDSMLNGIRTLAQRLGFTPGPTYWDTHGHKPTSARYHQLFGSWARACELAGLEAPQMYRPKGATHCAEGHPLSGENLYVSPKGRRHCRTCKRGRDARYGARIRAERATE